MIKDKYFIKAEAFRIEKENKASETIQRWWKRTICMRGDGLV